jgi:cobalt-zinc-cadmium efflux system membrane fusion protein
VRLKNSRLETIAGIRTVAVRRTQSSSSFGCPGRIAFDANRVADVRAIVPGIVRQTYVDLGSKVRQGDRLFLLESTLVGETQATWRTAQERVNVARANLVRQRKLNEGGIASARQVELAKQELAAAEAQARSASTTLRMAGASRAASSGRSTLTAPLSGRVIRRPAVVGLLATPSASLATIADTSVMWIVCDVPEYDAPRLRLGQSATAVILGEREAVRGQLTWIAAEVDPRTRSVSARAEVANTDGTLRANQFVRVEIEAGPARPAFVVPREALQRVGKLDVVFVRQAPGVYLPRVVRPQADGNPVPVDGNIRQGDLVVTTGAILLRTELTPGSIGAGCCDVPGAKAK